MIDKRKIREELAKQQPTWLDRAVTFIDPVRGANRMRARLTMAVGNSYTGASKSKRSLSQWKPTAQSADAALLPDLPTLRDRSHDLFRNAPLATGAINSVVTKVIGTGLSLQSRIDRETLNLSDEAADLWQNKAQKEFELFAETADCDITRTQNLYGLQELTFRSVLLGGDALVLLPFIRTKNNPYGLKIQIVEADRVSNANNVADSNELAGGVRMDSNGAPIAYQILKHHPGSIMRGSMEWQEVAAFGTKTGRRNVLHLFRRLRPGQTRGLPYLSPVMEALKQLDRYTEAEIMAAVVSGLFTVFVKTETGNGIDPVMTNETGSSASDDDLKLAPGMVLDLAQGEDISTANPGRPNTAFDPFVQAILRQIGVALELPFEVLIKHFTSSYTAARAALLDAWTFFRGRRDWLASAFCAPIYEAFMDEAVASGRISAPGYFNDPLIRRAYLGADWIGDSPGFLDPEKEVGAAQERVSMGISTLETESIAFDGVSWESKHKQRVKEVAMRKADGLSDQTPSQNQQNQQNDQNDATDSATLPGDQTQ